MRLRELVRLLRACVLQGWPIGGPAAPPYCVQREAEEDRVHEAHANELRRANCEMAGQGGRTWSHAASQDSRQTFQGPYQAWASEASARPPKGSTRPPKASAKPPKASGRPSEALARPSEPSTRPSEPSVLPPGASTRPPEASDKPS